MAQQGGTKGTALLSASVAGPQHAAQAASVSTVRQKEVL